MKKILALGLVMIMMLASLAACSGNDTNKEAAASYEGTYVYDAMAALAGVEGMEEIANSEEAQAALADTDTTMKLTIKDGENFSMEAGGNMIGEGTYKVDGTKITMTVDGEDQEGTIDNDAITLTMEGMEMVFTKEK